MFLVFAVWLPAAAGFALLARSVYDHQVDAARDRLQRLGQSVGSLVERELDKRVVMARTLGASAALAANDLAAFYREASAATSDTGSWVIVVTPTEQLVNTRYPYQPGMRELRPGDATQVGREPLIAFRLTGTVTKQPVITAFAQEVGGGAIKRSVGVASLAAVVQSIVDQYAQGQELLISVIDEDQHIVARSRDPQAWIGKRAGELLRVRAARGEYGLAETVTLDGIASLTYLSQPNRFRWNVIVSSPVAVLNSAARQATINAIGASVILLVIGIALVVPASRRISGPMHALRDAAHAVGHDTVPPLRHTGVTEADEVNAALHQAAHRIQQATRGLEERVTHAVREAQEAQRQLLDGQKHEAIGRITGGLAHDFNNLLQTISTSLQVIDRSGVETTHRRVLDAAMRATSRAADLVRQMLTFGRTQSLQPVRLDFADFLLKSRELLGKAGDARVVLEAIVEPNLPHLHVDPAQLELALLNLVFNARDALIERGRIAICARAVPDESPAMVEIAVRDNGVGMDEETRRKALEPYFTTKSVGKGSGLGLAQVHAFAVQSGGRISIESTPGLGTTVTMVLPSIDGEAPLLRDVQTKTVDSESAHTWRILMVEDDVLVTSVVAAALRAAGHELTLRTTADDALKLLATPDPPFDILFTDVVMPGSMSGVDLADWCRRHRPLIACVVASGYTGERAIGQRLLLKPYTLDELFGAFDLAAKARDGDARLRTDSIGDASRQS